MSTENGKICCNCIRERDEKTLYTRCQCVVDNHYISYVDMMEGWCRHWAKEKEEKQWGLSTS